jgi:xanthine/uracil permease
MPVAFLLTNALIKRTVFKQTDFHFFGGDMTFCGCTLLTSNILHWVIVKPPQNGTHIALILLGILVLFLLWIMTIWIGSYKKRWASVFGAIIGMVIFSFCGWASWTILISTKGAT